MGKKESIFGLVEVKTVYTKIDLQYICCWITLMNVESAQVNKQESDEKLIDHE